ncbi:MAG: hypothetical protein WAM78_19645 [Candidatus Sulfotelmatobacter sp.]
MGYSVYKGLPPAKPISGGFYGGGLFSGGSSSSGSPSGHKGALNDRQRRADYNALRRSGDCLALDVPNIVLWMDEELAQQDEDECLY